MAIIKTRRAGRRAYFRTAGYLVGVCPRLLPFLLPLLFAAVAAVRFCLFLLFLLVGGRAAAQAPRLLDTAQVRAQLPLARRLLLRHNDSALALNRQLLRASQRLRYPYGTAQSALQLGMALRNAGKFDSSFYYGRRAQGLFEARHQLAGVAAVLDMNAQAYKWLGDAQGVTVLTRKGLQQATQSLALARQAHDVAGMVAASLSQGIIYRDLHLLDSARACYLRALNLEQRYHPTPSALGMAYSSYGQLVMDVDRDFAQAIGYFRRALPLHRAQRSLTGLEHTYRQLSWAYRQQGQTARAVATADSCLTLGRAIGDPHRLSNSLAAAEQAYQAAGRYRTAIRLLERKRDVDDSLYRLEKTQAVARIEAAYRLDKQQAHITSLDRENARKQRQLVGLGLGLSLLAGLLGISAWQYRALRRANAQLQASNHTVNDKNARIQEQADRLTLLLRELNHRVKNNLAIVSSLLNLQSSSLADAPAARAVREGRQRVEAMGLLHQHLYQTADVARVDMRPYLTTLVDNLLAAYGFDDDELTLELLLDLPALDVERAVPLGLILNELVTNAVKHAYAGVARPWLRVQLSAPGPGALLLEVEDNGPGIAPARWQAEQGSFGQQLILALCAQLDGQVTTANRPGAFFQLVVSK